MYVEILAVDQKSLDKLILSAIESQHKIIKDLGFILEVIPDKGVYIIAASTETDMIPPNDLILMLTSCGTALLKDKQVRGSVQVHNKNRHALQF